MNEEQAFKNTENEAKTIPSKAQINLNFDDNEMRSLVEEYIAENITTPEKIEFALNTLKQAFVNDPELAFAWYCNIKMPVHDAVYDFVEHEQRHSIGADAACRIMSNCFEYDAETFNQL